MNLILDLFLNIDKYLGTIIDSYGYLTYFILFLVIFCETGLVVTPFLPGDSLLFAAGAFAAIGKMNILILLIVLIAAAILGDATNYYLGRNYGIDLLKKVGGKRIKKKNIEDAHNLYEKYGGIAIFLARFIPILRTFVPFTAGMSKMTYGKFGFYNIIGGIAWVFAFLLIGFFFGNIPFVKDNFSLVVFGIILVSVMPVFARFLYNSFRRTKED